MNAPHNNKEIVMGLGISHVCPETGLVRYFSMVDQLGMPNTSRKLKYAEVLEIQKSGSDLLRDVTGALRETERYWDRAAVTGAQRPTQEI